MPELIFKNEEKSRINQKKYKGLKYYYKQLIADNSSYIENANKISIRPEKKLCDITGLPGNYKCPRTGLYYYNGEVYEYIKDMKMETAQNYVALRGVGKNLYSFQKDY